MNKYQKILVGFLKKAEDHENAIIKFFKENPSPPDKDVHALADQLGLDAHSFEEQIYKLLGKLVGQAPGKHIDSPDEDFDADELAMGIEVEKEHTDDEALAKEIAKDHLSEISDYYTRLKAMEDAGKKDQGKESDGCPGCEGCNESKFAKVLDSFLKGTKKTASSMDKQQFDHMMNFCYKNIDPDRWTDFIDACRTFVLEQDDDYNWADLGWKEIARRGGFDY